MNLGKPLLLLIFLATALSSFGCAKNREYYEYESAKELFKVGMEKSEALEIFGQPNNILEFGTLSKWFYDHEEIVKHVKVGETLNAYSIDFRNGKSIKMNPIIVTRH